MNERAPQVSVIMPVYNGQRFVCAAVESILSQSFTDFELILVNDGSTDQSSELIHAFRDPRIRIFEGESNRGAAAAKNRGIAESQGALIAFLDCDDLALPERLSEQVRFFNRHPEVGVLGSAMITIDENGEPTGETHFAQSGVFETLLFSNALAQSTVMLRRSALGLERFITEFQPAEDYDLWVRLGCCTRLANLPQSLVRYRIHSGGISSRQSAKMEESVRSIVAGQLARLGLTPDDDALALHRTIAQSPLNASRYLLEKTEQWLGSLRAANLKAQVYDPAVFEHFLEEKWFQVAIDSWSLGLWAWKIYAGSPMCRWIPGALTRHALFLRRVLPLSLKRLFR